MRAAISVRRIRQKRQATGRNSTVKNDDRGRAGEFGVFEAEFNLLLRNSMEPEGAASVKEEPPVQERTKKLGSEESLPQLVWLLQPQTRHKAAWDIFISVMIVYSVLWEPFRFCFHVDMGGAMAVDILVDLVFIIDIVSIFFTAYYDEREVLVVDRWMIARRYLLGYFIIDVVSVFPAELLVMATEPEVKSQARAVKLLRLVRLGRLFKLKRLLLLLEDKLNMSLQMMDMLKMILCVLFIIHLLACLSFLVASPICPDGSTGPCERTEEMWTNWVRMFQVDEFSILGRYLASFHFITATLMAVGYGDIFPSNSLERAVCILSQITGAVLFGFLLSCITAVLEFTNPRELEHKKRMAEIKTWLRARNLPQGLKMQVWSHFCFITAKRSAFKDEHTMLLSLPTQLRSQLVESSQRQYFQALQASLGIEHKGLVAELAVQVVPMQVPHRMCIMESGELTSELYVVLNGRVDAVLEDRQGCNDQLQAFLQHALGSDVRRNMNCEEPDGPESPEEPEGERVERSRQRKVTPSRGSLLQKSRTIQWLAEGVGLAMSTMLHMDDGSEVVCGIYGEMQAFGHCVLSPLRFQGGSHQSEVFSLSQDALDRTLGQHPAQLEFEASGRMASKELARAILSPEWNAPQGSQRIKSLVVYRGKATDARNLPKEIFEEVDDGLQASLEKVQRIITKRRDKNGKVISESETMQDILKRWVIPANDSRKIIWDLFMGALIIYSVIAITYSVSFNATDPAAVVQAVDVIVDLFFALDMVLSFRTAFLDPNGLLDTVPSEIARHYLKTYFLVDFLSTMPIDRIFEAMASEVSRAQMLRTLKLTRFARLFRLMKLARMLKLFKLVESAESSVEVSPLLLRLVVLFMNVCFLAHVVACAWHWLSTIPSIPDACASGLLTCDGADSSLTWLSAPGGSYDVDSDFKKYVAAIYWVFTTMTTVGYGDFFPMNHWERAFAVAVMIFGATVFGYIVGSVAEMAMHTRQDPASQSIFTMRQYCEEHGFHQKVIHSLRRHYDFWFQERSHFEFEPEILQRLPVPLRREVVLHIHRHLLAGKISLFKVSVPSWLQAVLARLLEPQAFLPGELVLPSGETSGGDLIFVYEGLCEAFVDSSGHPLTKPVTRRRRKKKEVRSSFLGGTFEVLEAYGPGSMLGFEQLLGEEALQSFGCPSDCAVRASPAAAPSVYALRVSSLVDAQRAQPVLAGMLTELMTTCIVSEGRRRVKERATSEYYQKLEAYRLAKQNFQASPIALRFAAFGNSEAETIRSRLPSRNSRGSPPETPQLSVVAFATPPNEAPDAPGAAPAPPCEAVPHLVVPPGANASMLQATEAPSEDTVQGCQLAQSRSWEEFPALPDEGQPWSGQPTEQADVPKLLAGGDERTQPWDPGGSADPGGTDSPGHEASQGFNTLHQPQLEPEAADAARRASQASEVSLR